MESESYIIRNYDWLVIAAFLFGLAVTIYMEWIDKRRKNEMVNLAPDRMGIFVIYLLITLMPVLFMAVLHILLSAFGKEPDSMFSYVPYFLLSAIVSILIIQRPLKRAKVKSDGRFWAYLYLILGFLSPLALFINVYRPLTQPIINVESVDRIHTVPDNHDYFRVQTFIALPDKIYDRVTTSERKKYYLYYLGFVPISTSSQDTVFSAWIMFDKSKEVKNAPSETEIAEFREASRAIAINYQYDSIKFFKKYHRNIYNSFLQKSAMVRKPFLIITPSIYPIWYFLQDDTYLMLGIYILSTLAFLVFVKIGDDDDSED